MTSLCITCRHNFRHPNGRTRLFGCGCCAMAWQARPAKKGHLGVVIKTGQVGQVLSVTKSVVSLFIEGITQPVPIEGVSGITATPVVIDHAPGCCHSPEAHERLASLRKEREQDGRD